MASSDQGRLEEGWGDTAAAPSSTYCWMHIPTVGALEVVILSEIPTRYTGHFVGRTMRPCEAVGCHWCGVGLGRQLRWVLSVVDCLSGTRACIEVGAAAAETMRRATAEAGGLRGCRVRLSRATTARNSEVLCSLSTREPLDAVPDPVDVPRLLREMWAKQGGAG